MSFLRCGLSDRSRCLARGDEMSRSDAYDRIGNLYAVQRRPDPRWTSQIHRALAGNRTLVNVGAGSGSYEPSFMTVVAVEPSRVMIRQRPASAGPAVCARAEELPFADDCFDVALAVLTVHHWSNAAAGLAEMRRVSGRQVVVTWEPTVFAERFWFVRDYLPEAARREAQLATLSTVLKHLGPARLSPCWSRMTAPTAFSALTGGAPRHTWTQTFVARYRAWRCWTAMSCPPPWTGSGLTSPPARGRLSTRRFWRARTSTWVIAWSSRIAAS